jgi:hypothetical protein
LAIPRTRILRVGMTYEIWYCAWNFGMERKCVRAIWCQYFCCSLFIS